MAVSELPGVVLSAQLTVGGMGGTGLLPPQTLFSVSATDAQVNDTMIPRMGA